MTRPLIILTNDDGIYSPGLAAAALALDPLGDLLIVAPETQQSGMGRSMPIQSNGRLTPVTVQAGGKSWTGYAAHASPAQAVQHAIMELAGRRPALAVSGINYGENLGVSITISGTVGAALEAAAFGIPSLAVSLQVDPALHLSYDQSVDFSTAGYFVYHFGQLLMERLLPFDVDVLKIDVPAHATPQTPWRVTRLERRPYYVPVPPDRQAAEGEGRIGYRLHPPEPSSPDTDVAALLDGVVSVTPLSSDMTARVDLADLASLLGC